MTMKTFKLLIAALALTMLAALPAGAQGSNDAAYIIGNYSPGLPPTVGWHSLYGYVVVRDPTTGTYFPIGMPDLNSTAPTNDTPGHLTDYFIGNTANIATNYNAWNTNTYWTSALTIKQTNGVLTITSSGVDSANTYFMRKTIPYPTNNWKATLVILDPGYGAVNVTNSVSTIGLGAFYTPALTGVFVNLMTGNGVHTDGTLFTNQVEGIGGGSTPQIWISSCEKPTSAQTNAGLTSGINLMPAPRGPVALSMSYVQSTKVMTIKAGSAWPGIPINLSTIGTVTFTADPTNVVISVHDYDATGAVAPTYTRVIKAFQFEQNSK